jgi:hypothetical protein
VSAHRFPSTWRSIGFNGVYDGTGLVDDPAHVGQGAQAAFAESDYRLESLDLVRVSVQDYREMRQYLEGAEANEAYEGVRMLLLRGRILASSIGDLDDKTWAMYEAFSPAACRQAFLANDPAGVGPFDFSRAIVGGTGIRALRFYARPASGRPIIIGRAREGLSRAFLAQLVAFDARAYSQALSSSVLANLAGGANVVTNAGNIYAHPRLKVAMSGVGVAGIIVANTTTGQQIGLDLSGMAGGETLVIDTATSKMYRLSDSANRYSARTAGYISQFVLQPGANSLTWSLGTNITSVTVEYRDAYA